MSAIEPELLPRRDGILSGEHAASRRDLQDALDESLASAECYRCAIAHVLQSYRFGKSATVIQ